jgi:hypothetical protein
MNIVRSSLKNPLDINSQGPATLKFALTYCMDTGTPSQCLGIYTISARCWVPNVEINVPPDWCLNQGPSECFTLVQLTALPWFN